ncbi:hypothetical protein AYO41_03490 [Verrucomicrobia bacterium SCGC AG-212-E04]|nr:hypothetical protein AYO41_03490 [Verrucomicrobia bacterium SCGC AG-212-E04]
MSESMAFGHFRVANGPDGTPIELGRGGMGITYKAFDERLHIDVALKVIAPGQVGDRHAQALFLREARAAARVRHSNVASVLELDDTPGRFFFAMEFVDGQSLKEWMLEHRPVPPSVAVGLAVQIARGLEAIHEQGIVHRDLKPSNVMLLRAQGSSLDLSRDSDTGVEEWRVKIIDFGIAQFSRGHAQSDETTTQTIGFRGTALYASPEQCGELESIDGRADLYSLGCILWEMLCGLPPFTARTQREVINQHIGFPPPIDQLANLPSSVVDVLKRLLEKEPGARYPSAAATAKALEACQARLQDELTPPVELDGDTVASSAFGSPNRSSPSFTGTKSDGRPRRAAPLVATALVLAIGLVSWIAFRSSKSAAVSSPPPSAPASQAPSANSSGRPAVPLSGASLKSVAVLPFDNLSPDKENEYFADGVQDEVLTNLARIRDLKVISRTSVMEYRGHAKNLRKIADELGVATIVEGTVRRSRDSIRITVQLIDAATDQHLWAEKYDRPITDIFAVQSEIAEAIATKLAAQLNADDRAALAGPPTRDVIAYEYYLKARAIALDLAKLSSERDISIGLLEKAVARDPEFYDAWCLLASQYMFSSAGGPPHPSLLERINNALSVVKRLRPDAGETHLALGQYQLTVRLDASEAAKELRLAVNLLPNNAECRNSLAYILCDLGNWDEAVREYRQAVAIDPRSSRSFILLGVTLHKLKRYDDARPFLQRALILSPSAKAIELQLAMLDVDQYGDLSQAKELVSQLLRGPVVLEMASNITDIASYSRDNDFLKRATEVVAKILRQDFIRNFTRGAAANQIGDLKAAREAFAATLKEIDNPELNDTVYSFESWRALMLAFLGERSKALELGKRAYEADERNNNGAQMETYAWTLVICGEKDEALGVLSQAAKAPGGPSYGQLCLDFRWDSLRGDPRFEALVKQLAPKDGKQAIPTANSKD